MISVLLGANATTQIRGVFKAVPGATPYTKIGCMNTNFASNGANSGSFGFAITDGTKIEQITLPENVTGSNSISTISLERWTNSTTSTSTVTLVTLFGPASGYNCVKMVNDGTNLTYSWSQNGSGGPYQQVATELIGSFFGTISGYGFAGNSKSLTGNIYATIVSLN
jgi:hypothetical protein